MKDKDAMIKGLKLALTGQKMINDGLERDIFRLNKEKKSLELEVNTLRCTIRTDDRERRTEKEGG